MEKETKYNPFPLGQIPVELQRPELHILKAMGYVWNDDREVVSMFEKKVAEFWGAKYAVSVDCCTHSIELSFRYLQLLTSFYQKDSITVPARTYVSAIQTLDHLGLNYDVKDINWRGYYRFGNTPVIDSAVYWKQGGYIEGSFMCLSFQQKKAIPIGRGGAILTDDITAYKTLKLMSYDGRDLTTPYTSKDHIKAIGYHYYMTPEDCARGIILMDKRPESLGAYGGSENYPDIRIWGA